MGFHSKRSFATFLGMFQTRPGRKNLSGYDRLAIAICEQAAADYRKELLMEKETGHKTAEAEKIEKFFLSDRGYIFSYGMGQVIIEGIRKEILEDGAEVKRKNKARGW